MSTETSPSADLPPFERGEAVRIYVDRDGGKVPEDDWEYRMYHEPTDKEIAAKHSEVGGVTEFEHVPKTEFDEWQRERMAESLGDLATGGTVFTSNEVVDIVKDEETEQNSERTSWGRFNERGFYELTANPEELSLEIDIPAKMIVEAASKGFPPEYLLSARNNPYSAQRLKEGGIEWGAQLDTAEESAENSRTTPPPQLPKNPFIDKRLSLEELSPRQLLEYKSKLIDYIGAEDNLSKPRDPVFKQAAKGALRKVEVKELADRIEKEPQKVKAELRQSGHFVVRKIGRLLIAREMHRRELKERRNDELDKNHEDGLLRLGIPRTRRYLARIKRHDENVRVFRNKLSLWNNHEYKGEDKDSARRDLAELIKRVQESQEAISQRKPLHENVYVHEPFKRDLSTFNKNKGK